MNEFLFVLLGQTQSPPQGGIIDSTEKIVAIAASLATVASLCFTLYLHYTVQRLNRESTRRIWSNIASTKALLRHLDRAGETSPPDADALHQAYGLASEHFRRLLAEASLAERNYSIETIGIWRRVGKLSSDWQYRQALMLLSTPEISADQLDTVPEEVSRFDQPPPDHRIARQGIGMGSSPVSTPPPPPPSAPGATTP